MAEPIFTIGHSNRTVEALVAMLAPNGIARVVDIRTFPRSRAHPHFNGDALAGSLARSAIAYEHLPSLGGRRPRARDVPPEVNGFWEHPGFHNYADYALGAEFRTGLAHVIALAERERVTLMCAESVWWQCHRRIVADYLLASGLDVFHLVSGDTPEPARITPGAQPAPGGTLRYPPRQGQLL